MTTGENRELAYAAASIISDQLREQLENSEEVPPGQYDTTLAMPHPEIVSTWVVDFIRLRDGAKRRNDGAVVFRVTVQAL